VYRHKKNTKRHQLFIVHQDTIYYGFES
jgi:hypothetical protein